VGSDQKIDIANTNSAEMSFYRRDVGLTLRNRVKSSVIQEGLRLQSSLLHIKRRGKGEEREVWIST